MSYGGVEKTYRVLDDIFAERGRQAAKWGDQSDIADADPTILGRINQDETWGGAPAVARRLAAEYEMPGADRAKFICNAEAERHGGTWAGIVIEEVAETIDAIAFAHASGTVDGLRAEAIQAAACLVAFVEALDKRGTKSTPQRIEGAS